MDIFFEKTHHFDILNKCICQGSYVYRGDFSVCLAVYHEIIVYRGKLISGFIATITIKKGR